MLLARAAFNWKSQRIAIRWLSGACGAFQQTRPVYALCVRGNLISFPRLLTKEHPMRVLLYVTIPHHKFNVAVKDGSAGSKLNRIMEAIKPEAVYFTEMAGGRGCVMVVDLPDASKIAALAEPWFLTFDANVEFRVVMSPDDLKRAGLDEIGKKWG
jgi:hypothetical protein